MATEHYEILLVEDDESHAELIVDAFEDLNGRFSIQTAQNLRSARDILQENNPDLVITDMNLPDGVGLDLLPPDPESLKFPVIVLTGFGDEKLAVEIMKSGVLDYIVKSPETMMNMPYTAERALREWKTIQEKKEVEQVSSRLAAAVDQAAESIMITDLDGNIIYVNPYFEQMTGYTRHEVIGQHPKILSSGRQDTEFYKELWNTIHNGETWRGVFINRKKDGTLFEENAVISPVQDMSGKIVSFVAVKRDITKEVVLENQVRQSQKMAAIGQLAHKVAHDFTNVLAIILGNAQLAKTQEDLSPEMTQYLDDIIKATNDVAILNAELLAFAHPAKLELKSMEMRRVISGVEEILTKSLPQHIEVDLDIKTKVGKIKVDPSQLEQAVVHMAINSAEAMPEGGILTIKVQQSELPDELCTHSEDEKNKCCAQLTISDNGSGMNDETVGRIFEPFFTTKKDKKKNAGLGLSTVFRIIDQHGGFITVDSQLGEGTTFNVFLPVCDE